MNERIKKLRKALDLTQQEFADKIGMKRNTVANYETNRNEPSNSVITLICKTFDVSETWLRTGEGDMFSPPSNGLLDDLAQKYGLSVRSKAIVERFLDLKPDIQEAVATYIEGVAASFSGAGASSAPAQTPTIEEEARAEAEEYYREILAEKERAAKSSASKDCGGGRLA